jgi:AcrR family transcriptional regulator
MAVLRRLQQRRPSPGHRKLRDLSREKVIEAGLNLINRKSADAITMRSLADAVGVTPMALYNYFSSKRDLLRAVAEHVIDRAEFDGRHADWHEQIRHCFRMLRSICLEHPGLPRLLETEGVAPASVFAPLGVDDLDRSENKVALVTGAGTGSGLATAKAFAEAGASGALYPVEV